MTDMNMTMTNERSPVGSSIRVGMLLRLPFALFLAWLTVACGGGSSHTAHEPAPPADTVAAGGGVAPSVAFSILALPETDGIPKSSISVRVGGMTEHLADISGSAAVTPRDRYAEQGIPAAAIGACGAWWAGTGSYFHLMMEDGRPVLYEGWSDESQTDTGYHWKRVRSW